MARTHKTGLDYFSFDIDFFNDEKVEFVSAKYGNIGELIVVKLLCRIYRNGYFLKWGEDECLLFSKRSGDSINQDLVDDVISELLNRDFFCNETYKKYFVLTSNGIQRRFLEATKRRKSVDVAEEYFIADTTGFNVNIISLNVNINTQRKVKESKGKERKEDKTFLSDSTEYRLAELLLNEILKRNSNHKKPNLQTWAKDIDKLIRIDERPKSQIHDIIQWCQKDSFWQNNILSTKKLREKFDQLSLKMYIPKGGNSGKHTGLNEKDYSEGVNEDGTF